MNTHVVVFCCGIPCSLVWAAYICMVYSSNPPPRKCTPPPLSSTLSPQVDQWLDTSSQLVSGVAFEGLCSRLNDYLSLRSFFVGFDTTAADFAIWGQLHGEDTLIMYHY